MKVSIIGFGRFGKTLYRLLEDDHDITLFDTDVGAFPDELTASVAANLEEVYKSDVIFFCVPIESFADVLQEHAEYITEQHLLIDTLSVKEHPKKILDEAGVPARALLTHPMFGPDSSADGFEGLKIVFDQYTATDEEFQYWKNYFDFRGLEIVELSAAEHDELAARSQGVTHFIGRLLDAFDFRPTPIDTVGAQKLGEIVEQTCNDSWELFVNLQNFNNHTKDMRRDLGAAYDTLYNKLLPPRADDEYILYGIQGGVGSFNEEALLHYLSENDKKKNAKIVYLYTSENVLNALNEGEVDLGLFATHNSVGGIVDESVQAMARYKFSIVEDIVIPIEHFLMKRPDVDEEQLEMIMAHSQVFKQCKDNLEHAFTHLEKQTGEGELIDTAKAAEALAAGAIPKTTAILGPRRLAELYDLEVISGGLQDAEVNDTHFLLIQRYM